MTNARKAKRNKESSLRNIIDKRKAQAQSGPATEELDLKTNNTDVVSLDKESTSSVLMFFKQELLEGIKQGMDEELRSLDSDTRQRLDATGLVQEIYKGIKEGINDELKKYIDKSTTTLSTTMESLVGKLDDMVSAFTGQITDSPAPSAPTIPNDATPPGLPSSAPQRRSISGLSTSDQERTTDRYLGREQLKGVAPTSFGGKAREYVTRVAYGAVGLAKRGEDAIEKKRSLDFTIKTETELDPARFKGMSNRDIRKTIEKDQKAQENVRKKLAENEAQVSQLRRAGYSDADVKKLGYDNTRSDLLQDAVRADKGSRLGAEFDPKTAIGSDIKHPHLPTLSEEDKAEAIRMQEDSLKNEEEQIDLLKNIRDLLDKDKKQNPTINSPKIPDKTDSSLLDKAKDLFSDGPDIDIDGKKKKPPSTNKPSKLSKGLNIAKNLGKGLGVLGAGVAVAGGVGDIMDGKTIDSVDGIVPEGFDKLNPAAWAMNAGRYAGDKINKGVETVAGQGLGGWLYDKFNGSPTEQLNAKTMVPAKTGNRIASAVTAEKTELQKPPVINVPPPTVINKGGGGDQKVIMPAFNNNMRNNEPSISRYIRSIY